MYISGQIQTTDSKTLALPEAAVVREGDKYFIFTASKESNEGKVEWTLKPLEVIVGEKDNGWMEIKLLEVLKKGTKVSLNGAYYLLAEMKKGENEHEH